MGSTAKKKSGKKRLTKAERQRRKRNRIILITVEVFVLFLMLLALYVVSLYGKIDKTDISEEDIVINEGITKTETVDKEDITTNEISAGHMGGYRNVALFGVDSRDNSLGKGTRSDTIIVASINESTKEVKLVSVYRDTYLNLGNDSYGKANAAYAQGGPLQAINMLNMNLDLNITDYVTVGWAGVADTIDALGGVDIEVDEAEISHLNNYQVETSKSLGHDSFTKVTKTGMQTLNGIQAVSYCRIRYTAGDDFKRAERQQEVIQAILDKAKSGNISALNKAANTIFEEISTSLTLTECMDLLKDVASYSIGATGGFPNEQYRTTGSVGAASCVISTDISSDVTMLHQFLFGDISDYTPSSQVEAISGEVHSRTGR
ncbi:MAG: LCP family protein [Lachnospiraceae bacterium]|nr:LCP family protein [Lachnospiraceae bacterium]